jgi:hypothetical protein
MAFTKPTPKKADTPEWLRCQHTIRRMMLHLGKDSLVYAKGVMEYEDNEPERLNVFWESARRFFDDYEAKPATKVMKAEPKPKEEAPPTSGATSTT